MKITKTEKKKHSKQGIKSRNKTKRFHGKRIKSRNKTKRFHGKRIKSHTRKHRGGSKDKKDPCKDLVKKIIKNILREENEKMFQVINHLETDDGFDVIQKMIDFATGGFFKNTMFRGLCNFMYKSLNKKIKNNNRDNKSTSAQSTSALLFDEINTHIDKITNIITIDKDNINIESFLHKINSIRSPFDIYHYLSEADRTGLIEIFKQKRRKYYSLFLDKDKFEVINDKTESELENILPFNGNGNVEEREKWGVWFYHNESDMVHNESDNEYKNATYAPPLTRAEEIVAKAEAEGNKRRAEADNNEYKNAINALEVERAEAFPTRNPEATAAVEVAVRKWREQEEETTDLTPDPRHAGVIVISISIIGLVTFLVNNNE